MREFNIQSLLYKFSAIVLALNLLRHDLAFSNQKEGAIKETPHRGQLFTVCPELTEDKEKPNAVCAKKAHKGGLDAVIRGNSGQTPFEGIFKQKCTQPVLIGFVGDTYLSERSLRRIAGFGNDMRFLPQNVDLLIGNLEGPLTESELQAFPTQPFSHRMPLRVAGILSRWGFHGFTLANNHTMDYGEAGLNDTIRTLKSNSLAHAGAGRDRIEAERPMVFERKNMKIHIHSFNATFPLEAWSTQDQPGVAFPWPKRLTETIKRSAKTADFVAVGFHWGEELNRIPKDYQKEYAEIALAAGAHFIFGHHAHLAQSIENRNDKTIAYGLGNFVFDSYSRKAHFGLAALVQACKETRTNEVAFIPLLTDNFALHFQTRPMSLIEFQQAAKDYFADGTIHPETLFFIPDEKKANTLATWMGIQSSSLTGSTLAK